MDAERNNTDADLWQDEPVIAGFKIRPLSFRAELRMARGESFFWAAGCEMTIIDQFQIALFILAAPVDLVEEALTTSSRFLQTYEQFVADHFDRFTFEEFVSWYRAARDRVAASKVDVINKEITKESDSETAPPNS